MGTKIVTETELRPLPSGRRLGDLPGILRSLPHLAKGDAGAFAKDVKVARKALDENSGLRDLRDVERVSGLDVEKW